MTRPLDPTPASSPGPAPRVVPSASSTMSLRRRTLSRFPTSSFLIFVVSIIVSDSAFAYKNDYSSANRGGGGGSGVNGANPDSMASNATSPPRIVFDDQGFKIVYDLTNSFLYVLTVTDDLDSGFNLSALIESAVTMSPQDFFTDYMRLHWQELALYKIGFLVCVCVGIAFIVLMPIIGFCFCCCRSCGRCGAKSDPMDDKNDNCKRACCSVFLFFFTVLVLLSVVACFVTCSRFVDGVKEAPDDIRGEVRLIDRVKTGVAEDIKREAGVEYDKAGVRILAAIDDAGTSVKEQIGQLSGLTPVLNRALDIIGERGTVYQIKEDLVSVHTDVTTMSKGKLQSILDQLKDIAAGKDCAEEPVRSKCRQLEDEYLKFDLKKELNEFPDLSGAIGQVQNILGAGIEKKIQEGKDKFDSIKDDVRTEVEKQRDQVDKAIKNGKAPLEDHVQSLTDKVTSNIDGKEIERETNAYLENYIEKYKEEKYFDYTWYALLGLSGVAALITFFLCMGLMYGCGRRPGEGGCHRGTGANCLMMSVCCYFLFSWILMLVTLLLFVVGGQIHLEACEPILNPKEQGNGLIERTFKERAARDFPQLAKLNISRHLAQCQENKTILSIINDTKLFQRSIASFQKSITLDNIIPDLNDTLKDIKRSASQAVSQIDVDFLTKEAQRLLDDISRADLASVASFKFDKSEIKHLFRELDLGVFADKLEQAAQDARSFGKMKLEAELGDLTKQLRMLEEQKYIETEVLSKIDSVAAALRRLKARVGLKKEATDLLNEAQRVTKEIKSKSKAIIDDAADKFVDSLRVIFKDAVDQVFKALQTDIGKCGPVWDIFNNVATVGCKKILYPFNGFWFSMGWFLCCGLFTTFISIRLVSLYRKEEDYDPMYGAHLEQSVHVSRHSRMSRDARHYHSGGGGGGGGGHHYHHGGGGGGGGGGHHHHAPPPYNPAPHGYAQSHHVNPSYHSDPYAHAPYPHGPIAPSAPPPYNGEESYHSKHY